MAEEKIGELEEGSMEIKQIETQSQKRVEKKPE
jgi:hypothetical protein